MNITYHKNVKPVGTEISFPHSCLRRDIQDYLIMKELNEKSYLVRANPYYLFIHINGGRIDVALN